MVTLSAADVRAGLPWPLLIEALRQGFIEGAEQPERQHLDVGAPNIAGNLLIMPAWTAGGHIGVKLVTVFPGNSSLSLPAVASVYTLFDGKTGAVVAQIDGGELTARRTAAASVLAASFLARKESRTLLVLGTGRISRNLAEAYCAAFNIERVRFWDRSFQKADNVAAELAGLAPCVEATAGIAAALADTDIVTSATLARDPILFGRDIRPGTHIDLVGGFRPDMREADDDVIAMAHEVFVDTFAGAVKEAGDIAIPLASGVLQRHAIAADLALLCRTGHPGRTDPSAVTLFKSVGAALEDLAAAIALCRPAALP